MRNTLLLKIFLAGVLFILCVRISPAADTAAPENSQPVTGDVIIGDTQRAFLQLQEQIHEAQLAIVRSEQDAQAAIRHSAEDAAARFELLEKSLNARRADELDALQKTNHLTLVAAATFVTVVLIALLFTTYFQWRVVNRLAALSSVRPTLLTLANSRTSSDGGHTVSSEAVEQANARLLGAVDQLQQRIFQIEQAARVPLKEEDVLASSPVGKI